HSFFKRGDKIYISNKSGDDIGIGKLEVVPLTNYDITSSLIKHVFFKTILEKYPALKPVDFYPFIIQATRTDTDLLYGLFPTELKGKISYVKYIVVQFREIEVNQQNVYGFTINIERNWKFQIPCSVLQEEGFSLIDGEVIHSVPVQGLEGILLPDETLVGIIKSIEDGRAIVQTNSGEESYNLSELYLRKSNKNVFNYLAFKVGEKTATSIFDKLKVERNAVVKLNSISKEIRDAAKILFNEKDGSQTLFLNKDGFCFKVNANPKISYNTFHLEEPIFVFDPS